MDNYPLNRKKKHLLLLNRLLRQELKLVLIKTPSKLDDNKVNELFDKIFVKKDDYYVPKTNNEKLLLQEDQFKNLYKKKVKKSEPKKPEPKVEPKKPEPKVEPKKLTLKDASNKDLVEIIDLHYNCGSFFSSLQTSYNIKRVKQQEEALKKLKLKYNFVINGNDIKQVKNEIESRFKEDDDINNWLNSDYDDYYKNCFSKHYKQLDKYLTNLSEKPEEDDKKQLIELNNKFLTEVDKIIKIKSPYTFQAYKDKNEKDSYFIKLLKEYEKDGTIKYNSKYDEIFKKLPKELYDKQQTEDFYPTPIACIKPFEDYIKQADHILEPTAGLGHIVNKIREYNKDVKITAIEYTEDFSEILKILNPDVEVIKKNFLSYNPDKVDYDLIIINPPFTDRNDIRYYMNFLFQCLYLINRTKDIYLPTIIFISPSINDKNVKNEGFFLNDIVKSKMLSSKKLDEICKKYGLNPTKKQLEYLVKEDDNLFKKEEDLEEAQHFKHQFEDLFDFYQGDLIGQCEGFGGTSFKANLYRIVGYKRQKECNKVNL
jgi:hypothetical protein